MSALLKFAAPHPLVSVARNRRVDFQGPAVNATRQRLRLLDSLRAQPRRHVQATLPVVAVADHILIHVKLLQVSGNRPHGNEFCALDPAGFVFPRLAHINQEKIFAGLFLFLQFRNTDLELAHSDIVSRQRPLKTGARFSKNARIPSRQSSDAKHCIWCTTSASSARFKASFCAPKSVCFTARSANGGPPASFAASAITSAGSCAAGTTRFTRPSRSASLASIMSPV